jgi:hypothetical protein
VPPNVSEIGPWEPKVSNRVQPPQETSKQTAFSQVCNSRNGTHATSTSNFSLKFKIVHVWFNLSIVFFNMSLPVSWRTSLVMSEQLSTLTQLTAKPRTRPKPTGPGSPGLPPAPGAPRPGSPGPSRSSQRGEPRIPKPGNS